jgi:hypothetical protein
MSTVLVITPIVIGSWPAISAAAAGAAAALGFAIKNEVEAITAEMQETLEATQVEVPLAESEVVAENLRTGQDLILIRDNVTLRVHRDARGRCAVCAEGLGRSKGELRQMAEDFSHALAQHFTYNRVMQELKAKNFNVVNQEVNDDQSIHIHVRRWVD